MNFGDSVCECVGAGQSARRTGSNHQNVGRRLSRPARAACHRGRWGETMRHLQRSSRQIASAALSRPYTYTRFSFPTHTHPEARAPLWSAFLNIYKIMKCRGEAAIGVVGTTGLVSPSPRPFLAATEEGAVNRERRLSVSQPRSTRLPAPYAIRDYFVNLQQPAVDCHVG